jgi:hypothetical protein
MPFHIFIQIELNFQKIIHFLNRLFVVVSAQQHGAQLYICIGQLVTLRNLPNSAMFNPPLAA